MSKDMHALLRCLAPVGGLRPATVSALGRVAHQLTFRAGDDVFREGDPARYVFIIESGSFEVRRRGSDGTETVVGELRPGDMGGITSMHVEKARAATLRAHTDGSVLSIPRGAFLAALRECPDLGQALLSYLSQAIQEKTQLIAALSAGARTDPGLKIAFFDAKPYEREAFAPHLSADLQARFIDTRLGLTTAALARGFPVVCVFVNDDVSEPVIEQLVAGGTGLVALRCAGYNNVDLSAARRAGLSVVRVPAYSPYAVAEHAVALIMTLNRKTHRAYSRVRDGNFGLSGLVGFDLHGRTAGVVGFGKIGRCLATILRGFGMEVLAHDPYMNEAQAREAGVRGVSLDELLARSDVVSLHIPLTPETHHLIDGERLRKMKRGAMLINTSRGGLVDARALIGSLKSGHLGAAGLDVYEEESEYFFQDRSDRIITDDLLARLMTFNNVLITSHQAFLTRDALDNIAETTTVSVRAFLDGSRGTDLPNVVASAASPAG